MTANNKLPEIQTKKAIHLNSVLKNKCRHAICVSILPADFSAPVTL